MGLILCVLFIVATYHFGLVGALVSIVLIAIYSKDC
jgi:hypothetical protein